MLFNYIGLTKHFLLVYTNHTLHIVYKETLTKNSLSVSLYVYLCLLQNYSLPLYVISSTSI